MRSSADRLTSARLLLRVEEGAFASRLLSGPTSPGVRARVLGVLRQQRLLDAVLATACRRPPERLDAEVRVSLRIGLFEGRCLGVPVPVATDAAVRLIRRLGVPRAAGLVNAVLRRAAGRWHEVVDQAPPDLRLSHPAWLAERWRERFGDTLATEMMAAAQEPAPVWVWFADDAPRRQLEENGRLRPHPWCPGAFAPAEGDDPRPVLDVVEAGGAYAQDPSSQLVALLATALTPAAGERAADVCAAPGGKTALLGRHRRWRVLVAADVHPRRTRLMARNLDRLAPAALVVTADGRRPPVPAGSWDLVLLDAPCTGTGTLRRHPELRWRLGPPSVTELAVLQASLVAAALPLLAPGGVLVYATCSLEREENEAVLADLPPGYASRPVAPALPPGVVALGTATDGIRVPVSPWADGFTVHAVERAP